MKQWNNVSIIPVKLNGEMLSDIRCFLLDFVLLLFIYFFKKITYSLHPMLSSNSAIRAKYFSFQLCIDDLIVFCFTCVNQRSQHHCSTQKFRQQWLTFARLGALGRSPPNKASYLAISLEEAVQVLSEALSDAAGHLAQPHCLHLFRLLLELQRECNEYFANWRIKGDLQTSAVHVERSGMY